MPRATFGKITRPAIFSCNACVLDYVKQTITMDKYKGDEQEYYYQEAESMNLNNTFKKNSQVC